MLSAVQLFRQIAPEENPSIETHPETLGSVKLIGGLVSGAEREKNRIGNFHFAFLLFRFGDPSVLYRLE